MSSVSLFAFLFITLALLHAAEIAITTLYPWKVREFAEEEEKTNSSGRGVFKILNEDITRVLTTILVTSTACSIYGALTYDLLKGVICVFKSTTYLSTCHKMQNFVFLFSKRYTDYPNHKYHAMVSFY